MKGPMAEFGVEGPVYADRVKGRLTFRDWEKWTPSDQAEYRDEYEACMERTRQQMWADIEAGTFSLDHIT